MHTYIQVRDWKTQKMLTMEKSGNVQFFGWQIGFLPAITRKKV